MAFLMSIRVTSKHIVCLRPLVTLSSGQSHATFSSAAPSSEEATVSPVFRVAKSHVRRPALQDANGVHTYGEILSKSLKLAKRIRKKLGENRTQERVAFLCPNDVTYVLIQWACWAAGHIAVPLSPLHPPSVLSYYLEDSQACLAITCDNFTEPLLSVVGELNTKIPVLSLDKSWREPIKVPEEPTETVEQCSSVRIEAVCQTSPELTALLSEVAMSDAFYNNADAMILYTSGTTGKPKGVVLTHANIEANIKSLIQAWAWSPADVILHTLPLHHTHGIVNALLCPLYVGARCIMLPKFEAGAVWANLLGVNKSACERPTVYMAVPTIYSKLIAEYEEKFGKNSRLSEYVKATCATKIRLMVSGSAPLPEPVFHKWRSITGHYLLERYGMTEIGMALSNPLVGERRPGSVGTPLPGVKVRVAEFKPSPLGSKANYDIICEGNSKATKVNPGQAGRSGELLVKGPGVFHKYWNKPEATDKEFTKDGWFRTGDIAVYENGYYKLLGRASADIIKSGGYKISALEIETQLLAHPQIADCAVVGVPDPTWGQKVAAVISPAATLDVLPVDELKQWCKEKMPPYAVPTEWKFVKALPRNPMGKVNKNDLVKDVFSSAKNA